MDRHPPQNNMYGNDHEYQKRARVPQQHMCASRTSIPL